MSKVGSTVLNIARAAPRIPAGLPSVLLRTSSSSVMSSQFKQAPHKLLV
jgi:hypothetical protein